MVTAFCDKPHKKGSQFCRPNEKENDEKSIDDR